MDNDAKAAVSIVSNEIVDASTETGVSKHAASLLATSDAYTFHYEIDCVKVGNSIDVIDLVSAIFPDTT